jgi:hypothetical protein
MFSLVLNAVSPLLRQKANFIAAPKAYAASSTLKYNSSLPAQMLLGAPTTSRNDAKKTKRRQLTTNN